MKPASIFAELIFLLSTNAHSQTTNGSIKGIVIDLTSQEKLPGVYVILESKTIGTSTDKNGYFEILDLPDEDYTQLFSFFGVSNHKSMLGI